MKKYVINTWIGEKFAVTEQQRNFFQRVILLTIRQLKAEIEHRELWREGVATRKTCALSNEMLAEIEGMRETFLHFFPNMYDAYIQIVDNNERIYRLELQLKCR